MSLSTLFYFITVFIALSIAKVLEDDSLDLRKRGLVGKVRNQESCDAGWAFALTGLIEGQYAKKNGKFLDLSPQEMIDCSRECGCSYCGAETAVDSLGFGLETDDDYPFVGKEQMCRYNSTLAKVSVNYIAVYRRTSEQILKKLLLGYGPVYVAIDGDGLKGYSHGILDNCPHKHYNHAVLLIGYGSENGVDYWLIKNSWGLSWGEKGFGKIRRGVDACGLTHEALTVTIEDYSQLIDPRLP